VGAPWIVADLNETWPESPQERAEKLDRAVASGYTTVLRNADGVVLARR